MNNTCYFCGEIVPEGRMVCPQCEAGIMDRSRMANKNSFVLRTVKDGGGYLRVVFDDDDEHSLSEAFAYGMRALQMHPDIGSVRIRFEGEDALLELVSYKPKFERLRRITGYLSDTRRWNQAKQTELKDRVWHEQGGSVAAGLIEEGEG